MQSFIDYFLDYCERKYRCVPWYRIALKAYGGLALFALFFVMLADDFSYIMLCLLVCAAGFIALNILVFVCDAVCLLAYLVLDEVYNSEKRHRRDKRNRAKYMAVQKERVRCRTKKFHMRGGKSFKTRSIL